MAINLKTFDNLVLKQHRPIKSKYAIYEMIYKKTCSKMLYSSKQMCSSMIMMW